MKKLVLFAVAALGIIACDNGEFKGNATVSQSFAVKNTDDKQVTVAAGVYSAKVSVDEKGMAKVKLYVGTNDDAAIKFKMNVRGLQNAEFIPASQLGQNMDLRAHIVRSQTQSGIMQRVDTCVYGTNYQMVCHVDGQGHQICNYQPVGYIYGHNYLSYYLIYTTEDLTGTLYTPGTQTVLATLNGRDNLAPQEVVTGSSGCLP